MRLIRPKHPGLARANDGLTESGYSFRGVRHTRMQMPAGIADAIAKSETLHDFNRPMLALHRGLSAAPTRDRRATVHDDAS